jgi:hypothetical protein
MYFPRLPTNVDDTPARIKGAAAEVTQEKLRRSWEEINCRWNIYRAVAGSHIEL